MTQCASYALELFSNGGIRNHILGANIKGGAIEMHYYNRSIILRSSRIDFVNDYRRFLAILHGLRSLSVQQWGYQIDPRPFSPDNARNTLKGRKILLKNGIWLELLETVVQQHRLIGRGTCVVKARVSEDPPVSPRGKKFPNAKTLEHWRGMPLVVKWTSPPKSRVPESDILEQAYRVVRENQADWVLDHLPNLLHYEDLDIPVSNSLQNLFNGFNDYEPRVLRLTVFEELVPITGLHCTSDVVLAYEGIFNCEWRIVQCVGHDLILAEGYEWLHVSAKIQHCDISLGNLMYRCKSGQVYGVLNDFDLAILLDRTGGPSSKQRTGTKPFMAVDLLDESQVLQHCYRHDLESMFYAIYWHTRLHFHTDSTDNSKDKAMYRSWNEHSQQTLFMAKMVFLNSPCNTRPHRDAGGLILERFIFDMHNLFRTGLNARIDYFSAMEAAKLRQNTPPVNNFDFLTLGGLVDFKSFKSILHSSKST